MAEQRVFIWTGGKPCDAERNRQLADAFPVLPPPAPLRRAAHIEYRWGPSHFTVLATACSLRTTAWGGEAMTWLHCKGMNAAEITPGEPTGLMTVLIPAHYVTAIRPGPTFRIDRSRSSEDLGVFPPDWLPPADGLPLAEVEATLVSLLELERN